MADALIDNDTAVRTGPRAAVREHFLAAALELVAEVVYDRFTMDALAERAHASKATIYRHWSGKAEVVVEAISCRSQAVAQLPPDTGSLRGDLMAFLGLMCTTVSEEDGAFMAGILRAMQSDAALAQQMRSQHLESKTAVTQEIIDRGIGRGEVPATAKAETLIEVMTALVLTRNLLVGEPLDDAFITHLVDDVLIPVLGH